MLSRLLFRSANVMKPMVACRQPIAIYNTRFFRPGTANIYRTDPVELDDSEREQQ